MVQSKHGPGKGSARRGFGRLRRLPSGKYEAAYVGPKGVLYKAPELFPTKGTAEGWLGAEERLILLGAWVAPPLRDEADMAEAEASGAAAVTLTEYANAWLEEKANRDPSDREALRPSSVKDYRLLLDNHVFPTLKLGETVLSEITPEVVQAWYKAEGRKRTPRAQAKAYSLLKAVMNAAVRDRKQPEVLVNPCQIKGGGRTEVKHELRMPTPEELNRIAEAMPERLRLAVNLGYWCHLRYGEMAELRRGDIELPTLDDPNRAAVIYVRRGAVWVKGRTIAGQPKTKAGRRKVTIPAFLVDDIAAHLNTHTEPARDALLFPAVNGGQMRPSSFATWWHKARAAGGFPELRYHDLRHTGLTLAAHTGATAAELMARAGHSTPAMAMFYQHASEERDQRIADRLSALAGNRA